MASQSLSTLQAAFAASISDVVSALLGFLPQLFAALVVFMVGLYVSSLVKSIVTRVLGMMQLSDMTKTTPLKTLLEQAEVSLKIEELVGEGVRWLVLYIFVIAALNSVGLTTVGAFLNGVLSYLPKVFAASFILVAGVLAAGFTESMIKGAVMSVDPSTGRLVGKIASYTVVIFALLVAVGELGIAESFINTLFTGIVATVSLALGLAFGLGSKDTVAKMMSEWHSQLEKQTRPTSKK